jgi:Phage endonuclease I
MSTKSFKFRSGFEKKVYEQALGVGLTLDFEPKDAHLTYTKLSRYIPDFRLANGILIECKGRFTSADRAKMLNVRKVHQDKDIRLVFQRASNRITKNPNSLTYAGWAEKHGFKWHEGTVPKDWGELYDL